MTGNVVKFPVKQRVLHRLGLDFDDRQAFLDAEIRRNGRAMAVSSRKRTLLMNAHNREIDRKLAAQGY
jgi:hypothetical protein